MESARDTVELDDLLCFDLYAATHALGAVYRPLLEPLGLTYPQYLVLIALWEHGDQPIKTLASRLQLDYGTLTPLLKRMEADGLVERTRRSTDERSVLVALTRTGARMEERARPVHRCLREAMGLSAQEAAALQSALRRMTRSARSTAASA